MYNSDLPTRAELPSSARLLWSTLLAIITATVLLITIVLPSEYAIDPTGIGGVLGLTEMGEIKTQLAAEAETDRISEQQQALGQAFVPLSGEAERLDAIERQLGEIIAVLGGLQSSELASVPSDPIAEQLTPLQAEEPAPASWSDEIEITLQPGEGVEYKLIMTQGAIAEFEWTANGSVLNFDTHGDGNGNSISYERGRAFPGQQGSLEAAFTGNHGWFWRNRTDQPVTLLLRTRGDYQELIRTA